MAFKVVLTFSILSLFLFTFSTSQKHNPNPYTFSKPEKHNPNPFIFYTPQKYNPNPYPFPTHQEHNPNPHTSPTTPELTPNFYDNSCPGLSGIIKSAVTIAIINEPRMGASLLRLHFHDCFVNGCDASILLDDTPTFTGEKSARPNNNSLRGFDVIDAIKNAVDVICPQVVSCADILAIAAKDSVVQLGGPGWNVNLGRRDSRTANFAAANSGNTIPFPTMNLANLITLFQNQGLDQTDLVALSGAHTIGQARCTNFRAHIYNETNIDSGFARQAQANCPSASGSGDNNIEPLDIQTPTSFDTGYFQDLVNKKVLLHSDQELYNGGSTDSIVDKYNSNPGAFQTDFAKAMVKMGNIAPPSGSQGEIRKNCRVKNSN